MAVTNRDRVGRGMDLLQAGLKPFVSREMSNVYKAQWHDQARQYANTPRTNDKGRPDYDPAGLLAIIWGEWRDVFSTRLSNTDRSIVSELRETRNRWAHNEAFSSDDAIRALDSIERLLISAGAGDEAAQANTERQSIMREMFRSQRRTAQETAAAVAPVQGQLIAGLKPWREIVTPHPDVASGGYLEAEFAADLGQVYRRQGSSEYLDPREFFARTYLTEGLRELLTLATQRLTRKGGSPVVELQTNFGGGKTHTLLALYHMFSGHKPGELPGVEEIMAGADVKELPDVNRAVLVGTQLMPGQPLRKPEGTLVNTMWGELAYQLGGQEAYELVRESDEKGTNPGQALREVLELHAPCLILIDEWVRYAGQLYGRDDLPAGTFDTHFTFAQTLTEAARTTPGCLLVVSIPASDIEMGGSAGREALNRLRNVVGRMESSWRPASAEESFEIVRRRLFEPIAEPGLYADRDAVVREYSNYYRSNALEFPGECKEGDYQRRLERAYPIHPEVFDRLYSDWSSLEKFQRTRGVLRLMAKVIHALWERGDSNLLVMPGNIPIDDRSVQSELTRYLEEHWVPVIETDVDGRNSLPAKLDNDNPNLGRIAATRRVARTLYLGSAPTLQSVNKGIEDKRIKLGCAQPGESVAVFGDALRRLAAQATFIYADGARYWYSPVPTVTKLAQERAAQYDRESVLEEVGKRLKAEQNRRGDFIKVHPCGTASDVPDEMEARLVILAPQHTHTAKSADSEARKAAEFILENKSTSPRVYRNAIVFLAPDGGRLGDLELAVRQWLAWSSIEDEREALNLDAFQTTQAVTQRRQAEDSVQHRIPEAYQWLLAPTQPNPTGPVEWQESKLQGNEALAARASKKLRNDEGLVVDMAGTRLRHELDRVPLWRGDHVPLKQLTEEFAQYIYLPRLQSPQVLVQAVQDGIAPRLIADETFAYAEGFSEAAERYVGLVSNAQVAVSLDRGGLVVRADAAHQQLETAAPSPAPRPGEVASTRPVQTPTTPDTIPEADAPVVVVPPTGPKRFHGSVELSAARLGRDAGKVGEEVVQHLVALTGGAVTVTLEITAEIPGGAPESVVRTVTENCRTLKFSSQGFEED